MQSAKLSGTKQNTAVVRAKMKPIEKKLKGLKCQNDLITEICTILIISWLPVPWGMMTFSRRKVRQLSAAITVAQCTLLGLGHGILWILCQCLFCSSVSPAWDPLSPSLESSVFKVSPFTSPTAPLIATPNVSHQDPLPQNSSLRVFDYLIFFIPGIKSYLTWVRVLN